MSELKAKSKHFNFCFQFSIERWNHLHPDLGQSSAAAGAVRGVYVPNPIIVSADTSRHHHAVHCESPPCSALWVTTQHHAVHCEKCENSFNPIMIIVSGSDSWRVSVTARQCTVENIGVCPCHCGGGMWGRLYLSWDYFAEKPRGWHIYSFRQWLWLVSADNVQTWRTIKLHRKLRMRKMQL